jgi:hypothetical protein
MTRHQPQSCYMVRRLFVFAVGSYPGIEKREEMKGKAIGFRVGIRLDGLIETALAGTDSACSRLTSVRKESIHSA